MIMNVIQGHPYWCQQKRGVVVTYVTSGKLQIRRFQPLHSALRTVLWEKG